jgi:hypothetical protein
MARHFCRGEQDESMEIILPIHQKPLIITRKIIKKAEKPEAEKKHQ